MSENKPPVSTRRGDDGTTTLLGAGRLSKSDARIIVLGDVDEASSFIGLARAEAGGSEGDMAGLLIGLQRLLYRVMGDVAMPNEENFVGPSDVEYVDAALEEWRSRTELPNEFVVPGGSRLRPGSPRRREVREPTLGCPLRRRPQRRRRAHPL